MSTARMPTPRVLPDALLQVSERPPLRRCLEEGLVQVLGRIAACPSNHYRRTLLLPLENGTRPNTKATPHLGRNGNLTLRSQPRMSEWCHEATLPR